MTDSLELKGEAEPPSASPNLVEDTAQEREQENGLSSPSLPQSSSTRSLTDHRLSNGSSSVTTPRAEDSPTSPTKTDESSGTDTDGRDETPETQETPKRQTQQKSPLLTAHRLSTSSSLDDVNLTGSNNDNDAGSATASPGPDTAATTNTTSTTTSDSPAVGSPSEPQSRRSLQSTIMSSLPWSSSGSNSNSKPATPTTASSTAAASSGRKLTSPFSWLSRSSTKEVKSPPSSLPSESRRNTATSIASLSSVPEMLGRLPENDESGDAVSTSSRRPARNSLKDQFKMLRMREESGDGDRASIASGPASAGQAAPGSSSVAGSEDQSRPATANAATVNPNLPPGTVSGIAASAADASAPVDWDLWAQIVNHGPEALKGTNSAEISAAIRKGIPQTIRGVIWQVLADSRDPDLEEEYKILVARGTDKERERSASINGHGGQVSEKGSLASSRSSIRSESSVAAAQSSHTSSSPSVSQDGQKKSKYDAEAIRKLEKTIRRDLGSRTSYSRYFISQGNQEALFGLCKAYALYDEAVGYAQGINFIAMPLLFNMDECEAFTLLVKLMFKYGLREMFLPEMPGLHLHLYQFERLLEDLEPALYCHLRRRGVSPQLYATQWFLTLFAYRFPLQLVLRIYDFIFEEGLESTILRFGIAIMRRNAQTLLEMKDMSSLSTFLKERLFDVYIDRQPSPSSILESGFFGSSGNQDREVYRADVMVQDAIAVPLTAEMIETYTAEWSEKVRAEKEREAELESLRQTVAAQAARIRQLEEQAERTDKEHVQLASELVRLKVENEELHDKNESLLGSVEELKSVVDKQPAEVEERLRTEMERIMQRNIEVQNENRSMEEQLAEMERDLVATKMKWAELSENHESLKQKWADLRRALDG